MYLVFLTKIMMEALSPKKFGRNIIYALISVFTCLFLFKPLELAYTYQIYLQLTELLFFFFFFSFVFDAISKVNKCILSDYIR